MKLKSIEKPPHRLRGTRGAYRKSEHQATLTLTGKNYLACSILLGYKPASPDQARKQKRPLRTYHLVKKLIIDKLSVSLCGKLFGPSLYTPDKVCSQQIGLWVSASLPPKCWSRIRAMETLQHELQIPLHRPPIPLSSSGDRSPTPPVAGGGHRVHTPIGRIINLPLGMADH